MGLGLDLTGTSKSRTDCDPREFCDELCRWFTLNEPDSVSAIQSPLERLDEESPDAGMDADMDGGDHDCGHDHDHSRGADCGHDHDHDHSHDHDGDDDCQSTLGTVQLFPTAEPLAIETGPGGRLRLSTKTTTVGPGYHRWLCRVIQRLGEEFEVEWLQYNEEAEPGDDTCFFFHHEPARVDQEMLRWLRTVAQQVQAMASSGSGLDLQVNMPPNPVFAHPGPILTPLGPRSLEWLQRVAVDPSAGTDIFPWWEEGQSASMLLNRALCRMWEQVCWRAPLDETEGELLLDLHNDLAAAYALDPTLPFPWREWAEVLDLLEEDESANEVEPRIAETVREFAGQVPASQPKVSYRRGTLRASLPGQWSIELPGSLAETEDADGNWGALDADRQVWTAVLSLAAQDGGPVDRHELLEALTALEHEEGEASTGGSPGPGPDSGAPSYPLASQPHVLGVAHFTRHDDADEPYWELTGRAAVDGQALVLTVLIPSATDKDWALEVWNSVRHDPSPDSQELSLDE
ncbi:MAG: hypothetical protein ACKO3P_19590 [Planctomycetaceae bacterium]